MSITSAFTGPGVRALAEQHKDSDAVEARAVALAVARRAVLAEVERYDRRRRFEVREIVEARPLFEVVGFALVDVA